MTHTNQQIEYYFLAGNPPLPARNLADWMLENGLVAATTSEVAKLLAIPETQVRQRMAALRNHGEVVSPARGLWVPIPHEYRSWGAPEALYYIDALMEYYKTDYCIGWLSAAELYGASHQAPQVFQVATARSLRCKNVGRSKLQFVTRGYTASIARKQLSRSAGRAWVASPEATMLMLAENFALGGGVDNCATVMVELAEEAGEVSESNLIEQAVFFPQAALRRVGWILETFASAVRLDGVAETCQRATPSYEPLDPKASRRGAYNERWRLIVNRKVDPDL